MGDDLSALISGSDVELRAYGGERVRCEFLQPANTEELESLLRRASRAGRRVTFRGLGQALDAQSLNRDLVIGLGAFKELELCEAEHTICAGAGVSTGELARAAFAAGRFPAVLVTTSDASVGGTVASNCVSRFTPIRGQEGHHVLALELVTARGDRVRCSAAENPEIFQGVIGGLGYLGAITRVTLRLDTGAKDQVETRIVTAGGIDQVLAACTPPFGGEGSRYALLLPKLERGIAYACRYVTGEPLRRYGFVHEPRSPLRLLGEGLMRNEQFNRLTWWLAWHTRSSRYVDPLFDCTFFMDGNARMRHWGWRLGFATRAVQQSFLIPVGAAAEFLQVAKREFERRAFWPSLGDALYVPESPALLSASFGLCGFLLTFGFEAASHSRLRAVTDALVRLSAACRRLGGRVQLTKSVHARPEDVQAMYAHALPAFSELKQRLDPECLLRNEFLERVLPVLAR